MSSSELIQRGITFGNHAIECDHSACSTNDPSYYERAEANYEKAIEMYSEALRVGPDPATHDLLRTKITTYGQRCTIMRQWLEQYRRQQERETLVRNNSTVQRVFPYDRSNTAESQESLPPYLRAPSNGISQRISNISPPQQSRQRPLYRSPSPTQSPSRFPDLSPGHIPDSTPESLENTELPPPMLTPGRSIRGTGATNHSPQPEVEKLAVDIDSLLLSDAPPRARWDDVAGLSGAKDVLREATTLPNELPQLFGEGQQRWKSVLLYGPPGCGKRVLAEAAAAAYEAELLAPRVQDVLELMGGSGSAGVRALFANAMKRGRAVLYLSELEEVLSVSRGGGSSTMFRQARAQLLDELLALRKQKGDGLVFIGASRTPWELDDALLSRVERRVYVGLPDAAARSQILEVGLRGVAHDITLQEIEDIALECEGYSPCDLGILLRDAAMEPVRVVRSAGWFKKVSIMVGSKKVPKKTPCERDATDAVEMKFTEIDLSEIQAPPVKCLDFDLAMTSTKPSVSRGMIGKYLEFTEKKGQDGS